MRFREKIVRIPRSAHSESHNESNIDEERPKHRGIKPSGMQYDLTANRMKYVNFRLLAVKIGESLPIATDQEKVTRFAEAIFPFKVSKHASKAIKRQSSQVVYDWIMTLSEQNIGLSEALKMLSKFIREVAPDFNLRAYAEEEGGRLKETLNDEEKTHKFFSEMAKEKLPHNTPIVSEDLSTERKTEEANNAKLERSREIFVLMPFQEQFQTLYYKVIEPIVKSLNFSCSKADENLSVGTVIDQIFDSIKYSLLIIADETGKNPNVFYELGLAHCLKKKVLIITQNEDDIPFDIAHIRHFKYKYESNFGSLKNQFYKILKENLEVNTNGKRSEL